MAIESFIWGWGADLGDSETYKVKGVLNSDEGIEALEFYKGLYKYCPPDWENAFFMENNKAFSDGSVAMAMNFFAFFPPLADEETNPYADVTGFFAYPHGPEARVTSLGGQGVSVISYSKKKELAFEFLEWFVQDEVQKRWAELGGYTCNKHVLESEEFLQATPYNRAFMESMQMIKDFWTVPEYSELLAVSQKYWSGYVITDKYTAEEAMDMVAKEWEDIFEYAGYYKE